MRRASFGNRHRCHREAESNCERWPIPYRGMFITPQTVGRRQMEGPTPPVIYRAAMFEDSKENQSAAEDWIEELVRRLK